MSGAAGPGDATLLESPAGRQPAPRRRSRFSAEDRRRVNRAVLLTPSEPWQLRFGIMLGLSVVIAATGLLSDSPAVVIGAMLIAPLMTPVLGFAVALSMGWARRMAASALTVALASAGSIALAWALGAVLPSDGELTHEVVSRTAPSVLDLLVALAAGAAGAYATLREDVSAALPGVAVAVALVPPLATVGVTLHLGHPSLAKGALILYLTNLVAIVLASVTVLLGSGFVPLPRLTQVRRRVAGGTLAAAIATLAMGGLLSGGLRRTVDEATTIKSVNNEVVDWLGSATDLKVNGVSVDGSNVIVELVGSHPPPPTSLLEDALVAAVGPDASVRVRWSQRSRETAPAATRLTTSTATPTSTTEAYRSLAVAWLEANAAGSGTEIVAIRLRGDDLTVEVSGPVAPPNARPLAAAVAAERGRPTKVTVQWTQRQEFTASSDTRAAIGDDAIRARRTVDEWAHSHPEVVVLSVTVSGGLTTVNLAAETPPSDLDSLVAAIRAQISLPTSIRLAPLQRVATGSP